MQCWSFNGTSENLGHFRLSVSGDTAALDRTTNRFAGLRLSDPRSRLLAAYALIGGTDKALEYIGKALQADPKLGDDREAQYRYHAARAAVRAAVAEVADTSATSPRLDGAAKAKFRRQALDWLTAELTAWGKLLDSHPPQNRLLIVLALTSWQNDRDLAGIRNAEALAKLPAEEQKAFAQLWVDVAALSKKAEESADNAERLAVAQIAYNRKQFAIATRESATALANDSKVGDGRKEQHRYNAACAAALAATGQGKDEPPLDDAAKEKLRRQALDWLTAELKAWDKLFATGSFQDRQFITQTMRHWQQDSDLVSIRDPAALGKLPAAKQKAFAQLWADVAALLKKVTPRAGGFVVPG